MGLIRVRNARTHNLKSIHVDLPQGKLVVVTGVSGSGKSSLAFDTLYAEGQRRYVESLSTHARQFLALLQKPDVEAIEGLSPAIAIRQKTASHNPRSTVGTVTEIHAYLRLLYARAGTPRCPRHHIDLGAQTVSEMVDATLARPEGERIAVLAPLARAGEGRETLPTQLAALRTRGFIRARIDGDIVELSELPARAPQSGHNVEVVVDRLRTRPGARERLAESFETALNLNASRVRVASLERHAGATQDFSARFACPECGWSLEELEPRLFSFNNPAGACPECNGLGTRPCFDPELVIAHPERSLAAGALPGRDRSNRDYFLLLQSLSRHYGFDIESAWRRLPEAVRRVFLYGSGSEAIAFDYASAGGRDTTRTHPFEGVIKILERRRLEADSPATRAELARYQTLRDCPACSGTRLNETARQVFVAGKSLPAVTQLSIGAAERFFSHLSLPGRHGAIAARIRREINARLGFLDEVGLGYLTLARAADSLSSGETQRIRLAGQIGSGLSGVMYVLDEPSIGLHQRDNLRLLATLTRLRDLGNSVIVVEHDEAAIRAADYIIDMGPGAGTHGGEVVATGTPGEIAAAGDSLTGDYLAGRRTIPVPRARCAPRAGSQIRISGARGNNLKNLNVTIPLGLLSCVTGVSGSGKSTLVLDTLAAAAARRLQHGRARPAPCDSIDGLEKLEKVVSINQKPIGQTPRSNPATYTGLLTTIRELFAHTPEARARGYRAGRFSFNVRGGRCEACHGDGLVRVGMHFLPDLYVPCEICHGARYNRETLEVHYKGKNIHAVLEMTVQDALVFFANVPAVHAKLQTMTSVGLGYLRLGQSATTLSGGEAQRLKLARELARRSAGHTLYILDEPTTGLHFHDIGQLLTVLLRLRDRGNTIVVIEHNPDVIKSADRVIDLGPEGGDGGGRVVAQGTPEEIARSRQSHTGAVLARYLGCLPDADSPSSRPRADLR